MGTGLCCNFVTLQFGPPLINFSFFPGENFSDVSRRGLWRGGGGGGARHQPAPKGTQITSPSNTDLSPAEALNPVPSKVPLAGGGLPPNPTHAPELHGVPGPDASLGWVGLEAPPSAFVFHSHRPCQHCHSPPTTAPQPRPLAQTPAPTVLHPSTSVPQSPNIGPAAADGFTSAAYLLPFDEYFDEDYSRGLLSMISYKEFANLSKNTITTALMLDWEKSNCTGPTPDPQALQGGALCAVPARRSRLFSTPGSHGSQGPEICTPDAVLS